MDLPAPPSPSQQQQVVIGGSVAKIKTYEELVAAVINPSHTRAEGFEPPPDEGSLSPMPDYAHLMTVRQMIDIVSFLHPRYHGMKTSPDHYQP